MNANRKKKQMAMYSQIERNRQEVSLNNPEDYYILAKRFHQNATEFSELCRVAAPTLQPKSMALHTNACLACELFLKSLLLVEKFNFYKEIKRPENKHNLYDLYKHLSEDGKRCIQRHVFPDGDYDFEDELKNIAMGFEVLRYIAECGGVMVDVIFLYRLMLSLEKISKSVIDQFE